MLNQIILIHIFCTFKLEQNLTWAFSGSSWFLYLNKNRDVDKKKAQARETIPIPNLIMWLGMVSLEDGSFPDWKFYAKCGGFPPS